VSSHLIKRALIGVVLVGAISAAWVGGRAAWADMLQLQVRYNISQWQAGTVPPPQIAAWGEARNTLVQALILTPDDPQIHENLGYLYALRALSSKAVPELYQAMLRQAQVYYRNAARLRPMSPHPWANIALASHYLGDVGAPLWDAFDRAMAYGQREPSVQATLAEVGFARWGELTEPRRSQLLAMVNQALPHSKGPLLDIAKRYGHAAL
jgi:hypothetical protein